MNNISVKPFDSNWAYLKAELRWLDRVLMMAVARKRQDNKVLSTVANSPADKVTSHWWKGIVAVSRGVDDREGPPPKPVPQGQITLSYGQVLDLQIQATAQVGIPLGLPLLRDRCALSEVEKNILLMAIAPEINRRYGRLYDYLQDEAGALADLPTVDLCLRLLCRNDDQWQQARARLTAADSLVQRGLVEWIGDEDGTLLSQQVRVVDEVANYLLADAPDLKTLDTVLSLGLAPSPPAPSGNAPDEFSLPTRAIAPIPSSQLPEPPEPAAGTLVTTQAQLSWDRLILPQSLLRKLQYLARQGNLCRSSPEAEGLLVLLVGAAGTGKTLAASVLASELGVPLSCLELAALSPEAYPPNLTGTPSESSPLLLIKQGEQWFGRNPQVETVWLHQWWQWRKQFALTFVAVQRLEQVLPSWRHRFDGVLTFPRPNTAARQRLWQQAFDPELRLDKVDWRMIARQWPLTGGEIAEVARLAQRDVRSRGQTTITLTALRNAYQLRFSQR